LIVKGKPEEGRPEKRSRKDHKGNTYLFVPFAVPFNFFAVFALLCAFA
jgi:hypothetical protein